MKLWMGAEVDSEVTDELRIARSQLVPAINSLIADIDAQEADEWDVIAIIRNDSSFEERVRFSKKDGMDIRLGINIKDFLAAGDEGRKILLINMLIRSLSILKEKFPHIHTLNDIQEIVESV